MLVHRQGRDGPIIAQHVDSCLYAFHAAIKSLREADFLIQKKIAPGALTDAMGRFQIWSANVGAQQNRRSSLDYRLREASHLRDRVIDLLRHQFTVVGEAIEIINGNAKPWEDMSDSDSGSNSDASTVGPEADSVYVSTELAQLVSNMDEINTCLMRMSMAIRTPASHDQFIQSRGITVSHLEPQDIQHVRSRFPEGPNYLLIRLGKAISRRRQFLQYREAHRQRSGFGMNPMQAVQLEDSMPRSTPASTTALTQHGESTLASSVSINIWTPGTLEIDERTHSGGFDLQLIRASGTSPFARIRPPTLPEGALQGQSFECALCKRSIVVRHTRAWHRHVYRDLMPY
ncbi:hypothetical protein E8E13_009626 [Curvularia kusanoi]|uniref:Oxidoreductase acuF-like C2H2 type zinc-finger domain-containing protein n=1 Tax=Curvularia kusanoi TaxID=90978 RepID=A0A9P4TGG9_CURKU|nr:hypothetical protein E8E13_009626 [Curvularia kusanoi]